MLQGGDSLSALPVAQQQAVALIFLKLTAYAFDVDLVFFRFWCALTGYLIFRSLLAIDLSWR